MNAEEAEKCGVAELDGQTLHSPLRRGWYWGSEQFKEAMLEQLEKMATAKRKVGKAMPSSNDYASGTQAKDHDLQHAEAIIVKAVKHFGLKRGKGHFIQKAAYGDLSVVATAWAICRNTSVPQRWIAEHLSLGSWANVCERVRKFDQIETADLSKEMIRWKAMKF